MSKKQIRKARFVPVIPGDVALFEIWTRPTAEQKPFIATIIKVKYRYGLINQGTSEQAPLLTIRKEGSLKDEYLSNSFVTKVIRKGKNPNRNRFANSDAGARINFFKKGIASGSIHDLITWGLSKLDRELQFPIHPYAYAFYDNTLTGFVRYETIIACGEVHLTGSYHVHKKQFLKWVKQNAPRLCISKEKLRKNETAVNRSLEDDYWRGVDKELEQDTEEDFPFTFASPAQGSEKYN